MIGRYVVIVLLLIASLFLTSFFSRPLCDNISAGVNMEETRHLGMTYVMLKDFSEGREVFQVNCSACHRMRGVDNSSDWFQRSLEVNGEKNFLALFTKGDSLAQTKDRLLHIHRKSFSHNKYHIHRSSLEGDESRQLLTYIRLVNSF